MDTPDDLGPAKKPTKIITNWRRFSCGLWRMPRGDISAAYCADILPRLKVFDHDGKLFINGGCHFGRVIGGVADCYPLVSPDDHCGVESVPYSYEGQMGRYQGKQWRLGPKVIFEADDPTVCEWEWILRVLYADGGMFASGVTYREFLTERHTPESPNERVAHAAEFRLSETMAMPSTQVEMQQLLIESGSISLPKAKPQLELAL
ncbi:MAG: hypothetical protein ACXWIU_03450 [Limisphaerales bacterium]